MSLSEPGTQGNRTIQNKTHLPTFRADDRIVFIGQPRTGKTTLLKYIAAQIPKDQLLIIDPLDQYTSFPPEVKIIPPDVNPMEEFNDIARAVMARGNVTVIVEEAQKFLPQGPTLGGDVMAMLNRGRNYGIGVWASSQRMATLTKNIYDLASLLVFFRQGFTSLSYIKKQIPPEVYQAVSHLPNQHFVYYSLETEQWGIASLTIPPGTTPAQLVEGIPSSARIHVEESHQV